MVAAADGVKHWPGREREIERESRSEGRQSSFVGPPTEASKVASKDPHRASPEEKIFITKRGLRERETELRYRFIHVALAIAFSPQDIKERDEANEVGYRERNRREQEEKWERKRGKWYEEKTSRSPLFVLPTIFCCCCFCLQQSRTLRAWRSRTKDLYSIQ